VSLFSGIILSIHLSFSYPSIHSSFHLSIAVNTLRSIEGVTLVDYPLRLNLDDLYEAPYDGRPPASSLWNDDINYLYKYTHESMIRANYNIEKITPTWCKKFYLIIMNAIMEQSCDIIVYGNSRGYGFEVLLVDISYILNIPSITELVNLYIEIDILPTVIIAPSHYALLHDSIQNVLKPISIMNER
jgi:hypothetical protein